MKVENLVPEVYYKESRDFSFAGRLFEIVLNYMKTGADLVNASLSSENIKAMILDLLTSTLGFTSKHEYITKDLIYIASALSELMRNKGTQKAIEEALTILLTSQNLDTSTIITYVPEKHTLEIIVPEPMEDVILFEDLLEYIAPAGLLIDLRYGNQIKVENTDEVQLSDNISIRKVADKNIGKIYTGYTYDINEGFIKDESIADIARSLGYLGVITSYSDNNPSGPAAEKFAETYTNYKGKGNE